MLSIGFASEYFRFLSSEKWTGALIGALMIVGLGTGEDEKINNLTNSQYGFTLNYRELFLRLNKN